MGRATPVHSRFIKYTEPTTSKVKPLITTLLFVLMVSQGVVFSQSGTSVRVSGSAGKYQINSILSFQTTNPSIGAII
jgi:hypothetical protein